MALAAPGKIHTVKATSFEQINENLELLRTGDIVGRAVTSSDRDALISSAEPTNQNTHEIPTIPDALRFLSLCSYEQRHRCHYYHRCGYLSGYKVAWAILKKFGYPFTMFIYTDYIKGRNEIRRAIHKLESTRRDARLGRGH